MNIRENIASLNVEASLFVKKLTVYNKRRGRGNMNENVFNYARFIK
ncbi:MAG: hypothetical protein U0L85_05780 [Bacilli bacterium]|nr:hypothetical protein [Bacilli bacterium]